MNSSSAKFWSSRIDLSGFYILLYKRFQNLFFTLKFTYVFMRQSIMEQTWFGHPKGLIILFFTELWERFSYYGMRAILVLYVSEVVSDSPFGGLGWSHRSALELYTYYTMLVYLVSIPGGLLADKVLGQKKAVILGGWLLCLGHLILAVSTIWAFFTGLILIILGVGGLKPNISTMVGGLYKKGDIRRDQGFTIFYIGINVGAFLAGIIVSIVAARWGWHYGFGLAGLGMIIGQLTFMYGQRYLVGIGDFIGRASDTSKASVHKPLTKIERDRIIVLILSFLIVIIFWGAFEQAGGLMNLYANDKINRVVPFLGTIPAGVFQSVNAFFILIFGMIIAAYWVKRRLKGKEESSIFKMAIGTIIMGLGFAMMALASREVSSEPFGKAMLIWLILAYLLHTLGELCISPVALSFITKLAPVKYASIMMGIYFACTGIGNFVAGKIGESSQLEPIELRLKTADLKHLALQKALASQDKSIELKSQLHLAEKDQRLVFKDFETRIDLTSNFVFDRANQKRLTEDLSGSSSAKPYHAKIVFMLTKDQTSYEGRLIIDEIQNDQEFKTFIGILAFTLLAGLILLLFLKKLKALIHNAEEIVV